VKPTLLHRILAGIALALGIVALLAVVLSAVLLRTTTGARWALALVSGSIPRGDLTVRTIRGTLGSPLELRGVEYRTDSLLVSVQHLTVRWELSGLLGRDLDIHSLQADTVRIHPLVASPPPPDTTRGTKLPDIRLPIALRIGALRVRDFRYVPAGDSGAFALDEADVSGDFHGDQVRVSSLRVRCPLFDVDLHGRVRPRREYPLDVQLHGGLRLPRQPEFRGSARVSGSIERARLTLQLDAPCEARMEANVDQVLSALHADGQVEFARLDPRDFVAGAPVMQLSGRLAASGTPARFQARGQVSLLSDSLGAVDASGAIALAGDSLRVDTLLAGVPGRSGRMSVRGLLTGLGGTPRADVVADWQELVWPLRGDTLLRSDQGRLSLTGTSARYDLRFDSGLETEHGDLGRWRLEATGDTTHMEVARLEGRMFGGAVLGSGTVAWKPLVRWRATVHGDSLDPEHYWPGWPGRLAVELETNGEVRDTVPDFTARVTRLEGTLKHLPLSGHGSVAVNRRSWSAHELRLAWGGARLSADGKAGDVLDLDAALAAPDLAPFVDGVSGALRADMKLSGRRGEPHLRLAAHGDSLMHAGSEVGALNLRLDAGLLPGDTLHLELGARRALLQGLAIDTLALRGSGNTNHHTFLGGMRIGGDTLVLAANGGLTREEPHGEPALERWRGSLDRLDLRTRTSGLWRLEAPVAVAASSRDARLEHFCLRSGTHSACGQADWSAGQALHAKATLDSLPIGLLDPFLPASARLVGTLQGSIDASAERPEGPLTARVQLTQSPSRVIYSISPTERDTVHLGESRLTLDSDAHGVRGGLTVQWADGDHVDVQVALPGFNALRPDTSNVRVEGRIRARASDLAIVGAYVPGLDHTRGELSADLRLAGRFPRPDLDGEILMKNGRAGVPALGVSLQDIMVAIRCQPGNRSTLEGSARSGTGTVAMTGATDWDPAGWPVITFGVKGKDFTCADTREATVKVSPDLQVKLQHTRVDVSGQVDIPFARLVSLNKAVQLPVPPSPDVVLVGQEADSTSGGAKLHSRVRIVIGDDVEVRVPSFRGRPEGSILAIDEPGQPTRATGELKVSEGTYRAYGKDLTIERGRLIFGGGSISNPGLDLRASTTASDNTIAGFQITGTAEAPVLDIFSTPAMSQGDALSYIMFGKPMNQTGGSSGAAAMAGSQLSVQGTDVLARGVAGKLGIQDASVESKEGSLQDASLFIGTYLSPQLYLSYGIGLFESSTTIRMRYKVTNHWSVQTESGSQHSGLLQFTGER
jgi:translocation and assembly module TamB